MAEKRRVEDETTPIKKQRSIGGFDIHDQIIETLSQEMSKNGKSYKQHEFIHEFSGLKKSLWDYVYYINNLDQEEINRNLKTIRNIWNSAYSFIPLLFDMLQSDREELPTYEEFRGYFAHTILEDYSDEIVKDAEKERLHLKEIEIQLRSVQQFIRIHREVEHIDFQNMEYIEDYLTTYKAAVEYLKGGIMERHEQWFVDFVLQEPLYDPE